jgi:hypothetical protein
MVSGKWKVEKGEGRREKGEGRREKGEGVPVDDSFGLIVAD